MDSLVKASMVMQTSGENTLNINIRHSIHHVTKGTSNAWWTQKHGRHSKELRLDAYSQ